MKICDLCENRVDVSLCVLKLPQVPESVEAGDLCARCQRKVHEFLKTLWSEFVQQTATLAAKCVSTPKPVEAKPDEAFEEKPARRVKRPSLKTAVRTR